MPSWCPKRFNLTFSCFYPNGGKRLYDFRLEEVAAWIRAVGARTIALQMPEGLKVHAQSIARELEATTGASILIVGDPCYGACDYTVRFRDYADALVQFGHSEIPSMPKDDRVLFVEIFVNIDITGLLEQALPKLKGRIGLLTTVQHVGMLSGVREWLEAHGKEVRIGRGDARIKFEGQVLGCNITSVSSIMDGVDQFMYLGSGNFHPLSVAIESDRPVLIIDPLMNEVREIGDLKDRIMRQRFAAITRATEANRFLILVSTKVGQIRMERAQELKRKAEAHGKAAEIVLLEEFHPDRLLPYHADAYVSTACPRIAIDDYLRYSRPILTPVEFEIALGERQWSDYRTDMILG
ncbi:MAG: diphthamide biosynthesis enzyme Dph2 [Methanomassiliicoccus sp.]|nr:diphthamide biosynthesis enzyme Dph2 [Methanomassiliicoccus sp.]